MMIPCEEGYLRVAQVVVEHIMLTYISMHAHVVKHSYMDSHVVVF